MDLLGRIFGGLFEGYLAVVGGLSPGISLLIISLLLGFLMLLAFKWVGDPHELEVTRHRMQAHLMEMRLYDREPGVVMRALGHLLLWNGKFFVASLRPAVVATIPMVLLFVQMEHYYGRRPLEPGETAVVTAKLADWGNLGPRVALQGSRGIAVETPPVHSPARDLVSWRIRALEPGAGNVQLIADDAVVRKSVDVGDGPAMISMRRVSRTADALLFPREQRIDTPGVGWIDLAYPSVSVSLFGISLHWLVWLLLLSVIGAFAIRWLVNRWRPHTL